MGFFRLVSDLFFQLFEGDGSLLSLVLTCISLVVSIVMIASSANSFRALGQARVKSKNWTILNTIRVLEVLNCAHFLITPGYSPSNLTDPYFHPALIVIVGIGLVLTLVKKSLLHFFAIQHKVDEE